MIHIIVCIYIYKRFQIMFKKEYYIHKARGLIERCVLGSQYKEELGE